MTRLPTVGGDTDAWGTILNDYLTQTAVHTSLASSPAVGETTFDVASVPHGLAVGGLIAIDAYTTECEIRSVTNVASGTVTVDTALKFSHDTADHVVVIQDSVWSAWFGLIGDGTDEWGPLQRMVREATIYGGLEIRGGSGTFSIQQPLLVGTGSRINRLSIKSRTGFAPVDANGAMISVANDDELFTATASDDTFTTAAAHGCAVSDVVAFCAPYGETLPAGITAGRWYYVKTVPTTTTFTVSETDGGATVDLTADGAGWAILQIADLARVFWESLRLTLTIADLNGIVMGPQQPSWTRNLRVEMDANATVGATGVAIGGQLSYHDNVEINTSQNCTGLTLSGVGIAIRGFNCNGANSGDTGIKVNGSRHSLRDLWTEQCGHAGVEIVTSMKGLTIDGYWLQSSSSPTTAPALRVSTSTSSYAWLAPLRCGSSTQLILSDTARDISISGSTEMDADLVFHGARQQTGGVGPILNFRGWAFINTALSPFTATRLGSIIKADASSGDITINLPTAVGWLGFQYTVKHSGSGNSVIIDPNGSQTIDGSTTLTLVPKQAVTIMSDGANWHVMDQKLAGSATTYTPSNVSTDRAYDANATTTDELADVLGTLIGDLQDRGIIS